MLVTCSVVMSVIEIHRGTVEIRGEGDAEAVGSRVGSGGNIGTGI